MDGRDGEARMGQLYWALWRVLGWQARHVRVTKGVRAITLHGFVPSLLQAQLAERAVGGFGLAVCNRLAIAVNQSGGWYRPAQPGWLAQHLSARLCMEPLLDARGIRVVEEPGGIVVLAGTVATRYQRDMAESVARHHPGVRALRNELTVVAPARQEPAVPVLNQMEG
jgi:osmotically-inducible protein OsmY